jgi:CheY-like chemotaxis protein
MHTPECKNILIVDDEESIRSMMRDILEIEGYRVFTAHNGDHGIQELKTIASEPCVVLLDMMMPESNGWQFLHLQRNDPKLCHIPVVVCSAYTESAKAVHPDGFVPKPIQLDTLLSAVKEFCA